MEHQQHLSFCLRFAFSVCLTCLVAREMACVSAGSRKLDALT